MPRLTRVFKPTDEVVLITRDQLSYKGQLMNHCKVTEELMKSLRVIAIGIFLLAGAAAQPQHQQGMIENTTAPMSEKVIRQRLHTLGYTDVRITKTNTLKYQINAVKQGAPVVLDFHPQAGVIHEGTPGKNADQGGVAPAEVATDSCTVTVTSLPIRFLPKLTGWGSVSSSTPESGSMPGAHCL